MKRFITAVLNAFIKITGYPLKLFALRFNVRYEDKSVQSRRIKGKAIVASNHTNLLNFATMMYLFPFRTLRCVAGEVLYEKGFFMRLFLFMAGAVKVDRNSHDFSFLTVAQRILDKGGVIEIYPEARLPKPGDELPLEFKPSTVYLALESGAPIIPVYHAGKYFKGNKINAMIGKPIDARELYDDNLSQSENIEKITAILRGKIIELREEFERQEAEEAQEK